MWADQQLTSKEKLGAQRCNFFALISVSFKRGTARIQKGISALSLQKLKQTLKIGLVGQI